MDNMISAVSNFPVWIWPLFAALVWVGYRRRKPRVIRVRMLFSLPLIVSAVSVKVLLGYPLSLETVVLWAGGLLLGSLFGWLLVRNQKVRADYDNGLIWLPGSWLTLALVLMVFSARFYFAYELSLPSSSEVGSIHVLLWILMLGLFAGLYCGRVLAYMLLYRQAVSEDLSMEQGGFMIRRRADAIKP